RCRGWLLKLGVFGLGLLERSQAGVGVFPGGEEILIARAGLSLEVRVRSCIRTRRYGTGCEGIGPRKPELREREGRRACEQIAALEDLAKLKGGACAIFLVQIDKAADVRYEAGCRTGTDAKLDAASRFEQAKGFIVFPGAHGDQRERDGLPREVQ